MKEIWKNIVGYNGVYQISNKGRVKSFARYDKGRFKCFKEDKDGYYTLQLHNNKIRKWFRVHRLAAVAFISNPNSKPQVNHKDGDKKNNKVWNLEWVTNSENTQHAYDELGRTGRMGEAHHNCKLIRSQVQEIRRLLSKSNISQRVVGEMYNVSQSQISDIKNNKSWRHLYE